jgi:hypothetical protein
VIKKKFVGNTKCSDCRLYKKIKKETGDENKLKKKQVMRNYLNWKKQFDNF